jgi:hypothetical protein
VNSCGLIADRVGAANPTLPVTSNTPLGSENPSTYRRTPGELRRAHWETAGWPRGSVEPLELTNIEPQNSEEPLGPLPENLRDPCEPFNAPPPSRLTPERHLGCRWSESRNA